MKAYAIMIMARNFRNNRISICASTADIANSTLDHLFLRLFRSSSKTHRLKHLIQTVSIKHWTISSNGETTMSVAIA
uniref:Secreted protein n=1 Tax=Steinernema glaseri TaxID=37863 RepID=A0A1I7ZPU5_9BILA